jgi:hypothetical protein
MVVLGMYIQPTVSLFRSIPLSISSTKNTRSRISPSSVTGFEDDEEGGSGTFDEDDGCEEDSGSLLPHPTETKSAIASKNANHL